MLLNELETVQEEAKEAVLQALFKQKKHPAILTSGYLFFDYEFLH
jgi:hypothetical protein